MIDCCSSSAFAKQSKSITNGQSFETVVEPSHASAYTSHHLVLQNSYCHFYQIMQRNYGEWSWWFPGLNSRCDFKMTAAVGCSTNSTESSCYALSYLHTIFWAWWYGDRWARFKMGSSSSFLYVAVRMGNTSTKCHSHPQPCCAQQTFCGATEKRQPPTNTLLFCFFCGALSSHLSKSIVSSFCFHHALHIHRSLCRRMEDCFGRLPLSRNRDDAKAVLPPAARQAISEKSRSTESTSGVWSVKFKLLHLKTRIQWRLRAPWVSLVDLGSIFAKSTIATRTKRARSLSPLMRTISSQWTAQWYYGDDDK